MRKSGRNRIPTLKLPEDGGDPTAGRGEWEAPIRGDRPDLAELARTPAAALIAVADSLDPLFRTEVEPTTRHCTLPDGTEIEAAFDQGYLAWCEGRLDRRTDDLVKG